MVTPMFLSEQLQMEGTYATTQAEERTLPCIHQARPSWNKLEKRKTEGLQRVGGINQ